MRERITRKWHGRRALLNRTGHHSTAAIVAEVQDMSDMPADRTEYWDNIPDAIVQISDCNRSVNIEINWDTEDDRSNSLHKIDTMLDTLTEFRQYLVIEQERFAAFQKADDERKKKESA